jgi:NAD(P)-dependent dehydrogenase (short-subunit alcohol dehydrogenase family)
MSEFIDKVVIITGGSSGIGVAIAIEFVKRQAKVVICGRDEDKGEQALWKIRKEGKNVIFFKVDISNECDVEKLVEETVNRFGKLDIAINNAGISSRPAPIHEFDKEVWDKVISVNLTGVWLCMKYELK